MEAIKSGMGDISLQVANSLHLTIFQVQQQKLEMLVHLLLLSRDIIFLRYYSNLYTLYSVRLFSPRAYAVYAINSTTSDVYHVDYVFG